MAEQNYTVIVIRVNESLSQPETFSAQADSVVVGEDGLLEITSKDGRVTSMGKTTWGSVTVIRVPADA